MPLFVKPNAHGSSFGVRKVKRPEDLTSAIDYAFQFDDNILLEAFMDGREFGNGVMRVKGEIVVLPVTEIIPENEFFDFEAKYEGHLWKLLLPKSARNSPNKPRNSLLKYILPLIVRVSSAWITSSSERPSTSLRPIQSPDFPKPASFHNKP